MTIATRVLRAIACLILATTAACSQDVQGDYGPYHARTKVMRLQGGDTLIVYRVKYWQFTNGDAPALQLEYESPVSVDDTASVFDQDMRIWPAFEQYVETLELKHAIISATNLTKRGVPGAWQASFKHYGLTIDQDAQSNWHFTNRTGALPPAYQPVKPTIFEADGTPMVLKGER